MGQPEAALQHLLVAQKQKPQLAGVQYHLGLVHYQLGDLELAREHYEKATQMNPLRSEHWINLSAVQLELGMSNEAIQTCRRGLKAIDNSLTLYHSLARIYTILKMPDAAIEVLEEALSKTPNDNVSKKMLEELGKKP